MNTNYCFTCDESYASMTNLNRHFRTEKHDYYSNAIANKAEKEYSTKKKGVKNEMPTR